MPSIILSFNTSLEGFTPDPIVSPHESTFTRMQHRYLATLLNFKLTGAQID